MIFPEKTVLLKDGRTAVLRSPRKEDAPALVEYLKVTAGETEFLVRYPEEVTMTVEGEEKYIESQRQSPNDCTILCEIDGRYAGNAGFCVSSRIKMRHRGNIGIALRKEYWGLGLGTILMQELIDLGRSMGLRQMELEVFQGNERAMALYRKMGFTVTGTRPEAACLRDGTYIDEYIMVKKLV